MLVMSSSDSGVLDIENGDVYIRRTARDYPIPPLAWHETHRFRLYVTMSISTGLYPNLDL